MHDHIVCVHVHVLCMCAAEEKARFEAERVRVLKQQQDVIEQQKRALEQQLQQLQQVRRTCGDEGGGVRITCHVTPRRVVAYHAWIDTWTHARYIYMHMCSNKLHCSNNHKH